jgi:hypothetical protein
LGYWGQHAWVEDEGKEYLKEVIEKLKAMGNGDLKEITQSSETLNEGISSHNDEGKFETVAEPHKVNYSMASSYASLPEPSVLVPQPNVLAEPEKVIENLFDYDDDEDEDDYDQRLEQQRKRLEEEKRRLSGGDIQVSRGNGFVVLRNQPSQVPGCVKCLIF